jgi:hypothetical protein
MQEILRLGAQTFLQMLLYGDGGKNYILIIIQFSYKFLVIIPISTGPCYNKFNNNNP